MPGNAGEVLVWDRKASPAIESFKKKSRSVIAVVEKILMVLIAIHVTMLVYLLVQPSSRQDEALSSVFGDILLKNKGEKQEYGNLCDITNVGHIIANLDTYYLEHLGGWVIGGFALRSMGSAWLYSLAWEMIEWEFQYVFRVFKECWWDKLILDAICGNGIGIIIGATVSKHVFKLPRYEWLVQGYKLRSFAFLFGNYATFSYGSLTLYAFNDSVDIPEFHPFTFYLISGSALMMYFAYREHYLHFSFQSVSYKWRALCNGSITLTLATAWKYGLSDPAKYTWEMPEHWIEGGVATMAAFIIVFLFNIVFRTLPKPENVWKGYANKKKQE